ncbi:unnamed protein product [Rodentolepis nana]|uniref:TIR domain-containing protein n=1 Tax=Rodentolepis nana TaxID=102285 RepID=A0A158QHQ5_RODNA|nr:unnamed protein product [Rodentolepis nana]
MHFDNNNYVILVFLGGACNPTTWRKDIAIPFLEENGIPYFNPQVDEWCPDLITKEAVAKEQSCCLLFVFEPHLTRALASLVEVAYLAAQVSSQTHSSCFQKRKNCCRPRRPRLLIIVRPSPSFTPHYGRKVDTLAEAASLDAAYEWLEGCHLPNVCFFEVLEDALRFINEFYSTLSSHNPPQSPSHSIWKKANKMLKSRAEPKVDYKPSSVSHERLIEAYKYSAAYSKIKADLPINIYFGGATPKKMDMTDTYSDHAGWVVSRKGAKRNFQLSMAVQRQCPRLYFHISRTGLWIVDQMEAAFAIGSGKEVFLCVEYLLDEDTSLHGGVRSNNSSGYSSLAGTPEDVFHPPTALNKASSASSSSAPSRSGSSSEGEEIRSTAEFSKLLVSSPESDTVVQTLPKQSRNLLLHTSDVFGLSQFAVKDHNRSRSYLKSLVKETSEECSKGYLLDHPVESISDLIDLL